MVGRVRWAVALVALFVQVLPDSHAPATAQEYEGCFMVNSSGQIVKLSRMCGVAPEAAASNSADLAFIEQYKLMAMDYPEDIQKSLLQGIQTSPGEKIATAKKICEGAKAGTSLPEWRLKTINEAQTVDIRNKKIFMADREVIIAIAPNHYCPEFTNR